MNPANQTIKQRTIEIVAGDGSKIEVRRMSWKAARDFLKKLAAHLGNAGVDPVALLGKLPEVIQSTDELAIHLVTHSTNLNQDGLDNLDAVAFIQVLEAAVKLNLGDELKNSLAGIGATLGGLLPAMKTTSGAPSTSP